MGVCVLVLGPSGSGKSTSLRNFKAGEVGVLNVLGKPLPFRGRLDTVDNPDYRLCKDKIAAARRMAYVVDDAGYLMSNDNFARANEAGYQKFVDMAHSFQQLVRAATLAPPDVVVYLMMHVDLDANGCEKPKTVGKMLDEKWCIEGACPIVLDAKVMDGRHVFVTENDGTNLAKAPMGMLDPVMDNDLKEVDRRMREYWGLRPLTAAQPKKKANPRPQLEGETEKENVND